MNFEDIEDVDGVRFTLNVFPGTSNQASKTVVPLACLYKPLQRSAADGLAVAPYEPVLCRNPSCHGILNPYCPIDFQAKVWACRLCLQRNALPLQYQHITPEDMPLEVQPGNTTIEYALTRSAQVPPIFLFVVDTCQEYEDLQALKDSILVSLSLLPENALVGLISYGTMVYVHEIGFQEGMKSIVFNGAKNYTNKQVQETLGFLTADLRHGAGAINPSQIRTASRYLLPIQEAEFVLTNTLEQLQLNSFGVRSHERAKRSTGTALNTALSLLEGAYPDCASRIMLFSAGACTIGPGQIVDLPLKEPLRSHHDIVEETAKHYKKATKFYEALAKRSAKNGTAVDLFAGCYDQVGLDEMRTLAGTTGGAMVLSDSFTTAIFKQSFLRLFDKDDQGYLQMGFNGSLEVKMSKELKVSGVIGQVTSMGHRNSQVAETAIGVGDTSSWKLSAFQPSSTYCVFFDVASDSPPAPGLDGGPPQAVIQYITHYMHPSGQFRLRVTTLSRAMYIAGSEPAFRASFDQEAAVVVVARLCMCKIDRGLPLHEVSRWLDSTLIKICIEHATYVKDQPSTFQLDATFTMFPQFVYHLRRSQFLQVFNNSPDETAYIRHVFNHEDTSNCLIMIQPTLTAYQLDKEPEPVLLDSLSVTPDCVLLLDTFFHILIYHGETVAAWRKAGYQDQEDYENFRELLEQPRRDATELLQDRFPLPRFIDTEARGSQSRFLFSRLNPSKGAGGYGDSSSASVLTDDVSLQEFMEYLIKLVVTGKTK
ncbi:protein transport protein Sec23p [Trichomonascus vanleenenianus]|uniref:protein transport protein Sec23p n=1 Tax=Trichomonascus vanleenenianus TaxID=2268995 RepID=UPI003EC9CDEB